MILYTDYIDIYTHTVKESFLEVKKEKKKERGREVKGGVVEKANLEGNPSFIRPASTPKDQTEHKKDEKKAKQTNEDLAAPGQALIPIEAVVMPFFFDDLTLGPALVVALEASFGGGG